jgi:hypothetical protein
VDRRRLGCVPSTIELFARRRSQLNAPAETFPTAGETSPVAD